MAKVLPAMEQVIVTSQDIFQILLLSETLPLPVQVVVMGS